MKFRLLGLALISALTLSACPAEESKTSETKTEQTSTDQAKQQDKKDSSKQASANNDSKTHSDKATDARKSTAASKPYKEVSLPQTKDMLAKQPNLILLDVRNAKDFKIAHLANSQNLERQKPFFEQKLKTLDKNKSYLIYGYKGRRGERVAQEMIEAGFKQIYVLKANFKEIKSYGLPVKN